MNYGRRNCVKKSARRWNRHHMRPRSRQGSNSDYNLLVLDSAKHRKLHEIFGNRTLAEIIRVLIRLSKMKGYEREEPAIVRYYERN